MALQILYLLKYWFFLPWDSCTVPIIKKKEKGIGDYCTSLEFGPRRTSIYIYIYIYIVLPPSKNTILKSNHLNFD
jgi:hypothetical protein